MKKIVSGILSLAVLLSALLMPVFASETEVIQVGDAKMTFAAFVENYAQYAASEVTLLADVDATALTAPLAEFSGILNGNGKAVKGLSVPLFEALKGATVKDLTIKGAIGTNSVMEESATDIGALAKTTTEEVNLTNVVGEVEVNVRLTGDQKGVSGLIGEITSGSVKLTSCVQNANILSVNVMNSTKNERPFVGGLVGVIESGSLTLIACVNNGTHRAEYLRNNTSMVFAIGGLVARANGGSAVSFVKCVNYGDIGRPEESLNEIRCEHYKNAGFLAIARSSGGISFDSCVNYGNIEGGTTLSGIGVGGFIGELKDTVSMNNCYNYGKIIRNEGHYAGGFIGDFNSTGTSTIANCVNFGANETVREETTGTFVGNFLAGTLELVSCVSIGNGEMKSVGTITGTLTDNTVSYADVAAWRAAVAEQNTVYVQTSAAENGSFRVRFASSLSTVEGYARAGFEIIRLVGNESVGAVDVEVKTVYESLNGTNAKGQTITYTPADLAKDAKYFSAAVINNVPADQEITFIVRPYLVKADTAEVVLGVAEVFTFINDVLVMD